MNMYVNIKKGKIKIKVRTSQQKEIKYIIKKKKCLKIEGKRKG